MPKNSVLKVQDKLLTYLEQVEGEVNNSGLSEAITKTFPLSLLSQTIQEAELLVPVIGAFSAGKSSLLNSFLGKEYLPEGLTPETALATELRYSDEEYIEAVKADGAFEKFTMAEMETIKNRAAEFKFLRMYITNQNLKAIEPLILVDMPGFESPLDLHNQAITEYIDKGVHYIVLTSVEDGTITRSMVRQLSDIQEFGRDFSFFLSKTNLRAESEVEEITEGVIEQLEDHFDITANVLPIDDNGGASLQNILAEIAPEALFESLFITQLKDNFYTITEAINTAVSVSGKSKEKNEQAIRDLQRALTDLIKERDRLSEEAKEKYSDVNVTRIVDAVGRELSVSLDELVSMAMNNGQDALSQLIAEIIRHALVTGLKDSMSDIGNDIVETFSVSLTDLNRSMSDFSMTDNWLEKVTDSTKTLFNSAQGGIDNIIQQRRSKVDTDQMYKVITTVLAVTTTVLTPILEVIIIFLPELLSALLEKRQQQKQAEQIRNVMQTQMIPSVKRELRSKLPALFNQQVQEMIANISQQFEVVIEDKQTAIAETQRDIESKITDIDEVIRKYKETNEAITTLANNTIFM